MTTTWISRWAGSYTFLSCSYWAPQYVNTLKRILGQGFDRCLFIHRKGTVSFFVTKGDLDRLGAHLARKTVAHEAEALELLETLKRNTDVLMDMMRVLEGKIPTVAAYGEFIEVFDQHLAYHNFMKKTVDYLPTHLLERLLPQFIEARQYSEAVYSMSEQFFRSLAHAIAKQSNYDASLLTCLTQEELETFLSRGTLPAMETLRARYDHSVIRFEKGTLTILTGGAAQETEQSLFGATDVQQLTGTTAHAGRVEGTCRVIANPLTSNIFNVGDILVTGMTRPEFAPYVEKAAAIVTDVGGILCHAAVIARELRKPCLIGTGNATKVFHDGDRIEVDATAGVVRKIN